MSRNAISKQHGFTILEIIATLLIMVSLAVLWGSFGKKRYSAQKEQDEITKFVDAFSEAVYFCRLKSIPAGNDMVLKIAQDCFELSSKPSMEQLTRGSFNKDLFTDLKFWTNPQSGTPEEMREQEIIFKKKFCEPFKLKFKFVYQGIGKDKTISVNRPSVINLKTGELALVIKLEP
jgi:prepilin-type N-terminal cleavage/methylation domain-containing protein